MSAASRSLKVRSLLLVTVLIAATGSPGRADIGVPVRIGMPPDTRQAASGQGYEGVFEVQAKAAGTLSDLQIEGKGWRIVAADLPATVQVAKDEVLRVAFKAVPADADQPLWLSLRFDGRSRRQKVEIGPAAFARRDVVPAAVLAPNSPPPSPAPTPRPPGEYIDADAFGLSLRTQQVAQTIRFRGRIVYERPEEVRPSWEANKAYNPGDRVAPSTYSDFLYECVVGGTSGATEPSWPTTAGLMVTDNTVQWRTDPSPVTIQGVDGIWFQVMDDDAPFPDEVIVEGYTDEDGYFDVTVDWDDYDPWPDTPDIYIRYECDTLVVTVQKDDIWQTDYSWDTESTLFYPDFDGGEINFGFLKPPFMPDQPALHIHNSIVRAWRYVRDSSTFSEINPPVVEVEWPDSEWPNYSGGVIEIRGDFSWKENTHIHEYGHHVMHYLVDMPAWDYCTGFCDNDPPDDCGHCMWCPESSVIAWNEGWPNWLADAVTRDHPGRYGYDTLFGESLEDLVFCGSNGLRPNPLITEGFASAFLRDIEDSTNDDTSYAADVNGNGTIDIIWDPDGDGVGESNFWDGDGDGTPDPGGPDGITDSLALGPEEILYVLKQSRPTTTMEFLAGFRIHFAQYNCGLYQTALNIAPEFAWTDTTPPGALPPGSVTSPSHPAGIGGDWPEVTLVIYPPFDDATGYDAYSFQWSTVPDPGLPDTTPEVVACPTSVTNFVSSLQSDLALGDTHYVSIRARDAAGNWSPDYSVHGPFKIVSCNANDIVDACEFPEGCAEFSVLCGGPSGPACHDDSDCNGNHSPDSCDLAMAISLNCNQNQWPDECERVAHWIGGSGNDWATAANWDLEGTLPDYYHAVCIDLPGDDPVTITSPGVLVRSVYCAENLSLLNGYGLTMWDESVIVGSLEQNGKLDSAGGLEVLGTWTSLADVVNNLTFLTEHVHARGPFNKAAGGTVTWSYVDLHLWGPATWTGGGVQLRNQSVLHVESGAVLNLQSDAAISEATSSDAGRVEVDGQVVKNGGTGGFVFQGVDCINRASIEVQSGWISVGPGEAHSGSEYVANVPGTHFVFGGGHLLNPGSSLVAREVILEGAVVKGDYNVSNKTTVRSSGNAFQAGANLLDLGATTEVLGTVSFDTGTPVNLNEVLLGDTTTGGTISGADEVNVLGPMTWSGGTMTGGVLRTQGGLLLPALPHDHILIGRRLVLESPTTWLGGPINLYNGAMLENRSTFDLAWELYPEINYIDGGSVVFLNYGTLQRTHAGGPTLIRVPTINEGTVAIDAGTLQFASNGRYQQVAGVTSVAPGATLISSKLVEICGGEICGGGIIQGDVFLCGGVMAPGCSPGTLTVVGAYIQQAAGPQQAGGTLDIEIGGPTPIEYDQLQVTGNATLAGRLRLTLINDYSPSAGTTFAVVTFASRAGQFAEIVGPAARRFTVSHNSMNVTLTAVAPAPADFDGDGVVDTEDWAVFEDCALGPAIPHTGTTTCQQADLDGDGDVDQADFGLFQRCWSGPDNPADPACAG